MTRLGDDKKLRKGGRYARVMGTLWRCSKRERCGRAAMGLLLDIWSWCADQQVSVLPEKALRRLLAGDPNGRRQLRELISAGFLDEVEGGYMPHDWHEHSGVPAAPQEPPSDDSATRDEMDVRRECDGLRDESATRYEMNTGPERTQETTLLRVRALTQIPDPINPEENTQNPDARVRAMGLVGPPPANLQVEPPPIGQSPASPEREPGEPDFERPQPTGAAHQAEVLEGFRAAFFQADAGTMPRLWGKRLDHAVEHCRDLHKAYGLKLRVTLRDVAAAVAEAAEPGAKGWDFEVSKVDPYTRPKATRRRAGGRMSMAPATTHADFADAEPFEDQLARVRGES